MLINLFISEIDNQFYVFFNYYVIYKKKYLQRFFIDIFYMVVMKIRMKIDIQFNDVLVKGQNKFICIVVIDNVDIVIVEDLNKKGVKNKVFEIGQEKLLRKYIKVVRVNFEKQEFQVFDEESENDFGFIKIEVEEILVFKIKFVKRKESELYGDLIRFIIFEIVNIIQNVIFVFKSSVDMNYVELEYDFYFDMLGIRCRVFLDGYNLVEYMGIIKVLLKLVVLEKVLERLKQICWIIKIKQVVDVSEFEVSRDKVMGEI